MKTIVFLLLPVLISTPALTQTKYEKETRVRKSNVPAIAADIADLFNFKTRIRWYKETGLSSISFEAKTRYKGKNHSIEFSEDGTFEDIEIEIDASEISAETYGRIAEYISGQHNKYSFHKIQVQYSGNSSQISAFIHGKGTSTDIITNYEIVISSKVEGAFKMLEYLFSESGTYIRKAEIKLNPTDNIEY